MMILHEKLWPAHNDQSNLIHFIKNKCHSPQQTTIVLG